MKHIKKAVLMILALVFLATGISACSATPVRSDASSSNAPAGRAPAYTAYAPSSGAPVASAASGEYAPANGAPGFQQPQGYTGRYQAFKGETYNAIDESKFVAVVAKPLSTISADVDTASYANVRRMILDGQKPDPDAVRIEEMLNYFTYDLPQPTNGEPFSVTAELAPCPWNDQTKLLMVGLQAQKINTENIPPSNLVFLIDTSGSMADPNKLDLLQKSFLMLTQQMRPQDTVSIVTYSSSDSVVLSGVSGREKNWIMRAITDLTASGSTNGSAGIVTAYRQAQRFFIDGGNNRVILATDGDFNVGMTSEGDLKDLIARQRSSGIYLSVLGFGTGNLNDANLEALADNGNGNYSYIDSLFEARKALIQELGGNMFTVAKDVKLQTEFNPARVKGYRLIGYEDRIMDDQDFNNDAKDAGEMGAGQRVMVLYEIADAESAYPVAGTGLKYQAPQTTGNSNEWLTVSIRYKQPNQDESVLRAYPVDNSYYADELSGNMKFAAAVAETGMLMRNSEYKGSATCQSALDLLGGIQGLADDPYKDEFRYMVNRLSMMW